MCAQAEPNQNMRNRAMRQRSREREVGENNVSLFEDDDLDMYGRRSFLNRVLKKKPLSEQKQKKKKNNDPAPISSYSSPASQTF